MTSQAPPARSDGRWLWLMADLSLDRARLVLPSIDFPNVDPGKVQNAVRSVGEALSPGAPYFRELHPIIVQNLHENLASDAHFVEEWLEHFPYDDESVRPAPSYWNTRFADFFIIDPAPSPNDVDPMVWAALGAAFRREPVLPNLPRDLETAMAEATAATSVYTNAMTSIDLARRQPLSPYDLEVYTRFDWNDHGMQKGLGSFEVGARLTWLSRLWRAFAPLVSDEGARSIENLAHERDLESWQQARSDPSLEFEAKRYRVSKDDLLADVFPTPVPPPSLKLLTER